VSRASAILLALAASLCTATSSVCQRLGAASLPPVSGDSPVSDADSAAAAAPIRGFDPLLVFRLARRPVWLLGFAGMLAGFGCQLTALRFGPLALVQPVLAVELIFVFGFLAALNPGQVRARDWAAAIAMSAGVAVFLTAAAPDGGSQHASRTAWWIAAIVVAAAIAAAIALSEARVNAGGRGGPAWRAACLGVATGIGWGFVAAIIKELSSQLSGGLQQVFTTWPVYALMAAGAAAMLLTAHAMTAGPLAASQPGFTILDPLTAAFLGVVLYDEHLRTSPLALTAEALALGALAAGAATLTRSTLLEGGQR
jgi:drug/metabolite transporter (DMT)-like permease